LLTNEVSYACGPWADTPRWERNTEPDGRADKRAVVRELGRSVPALVALGLRFQEAVAHRVGINATDLKCLNILRELGSATAGELADRTGLTTGAVTRMIDRLVRAGYVRRHHDTTDRRRVIVSPEPEPLAELAGIYDGMNTAWTELLTSYPADKLEFLLDVLRRLREVAHNETDRVRRTMG
jgi:DNA-binding MarR family transcriptional regulator